MLGNLIAGICFTFVGIWILFSNVEPEIARILFSALFSFLGIILLVGSLYFIIKDWNKDKQK